MQGLVLGGFIGGVRMQAGVFAGGPFGVFSVLGMLCGVGVVSGYALLGAGWLVWKGEGPTQVFGREIGGAALLLTGAMMLLVSAWTALSDAAVAARWFGWPNLALLAPVPLITRLAAYALWHSLWSTHETRAFRLAILMFLLGFVGLAISLWPYIIPQQVTIWSGVADPQTLWFAGVGLVIVIPVVLSHQAYAYWVFRGKTRAETSSDTERPLQTRLAPPDQPSLPLG